jgi:hypothetical protein
MRFDSEAQRLERDHRLALVEWPQSETRMTRCSENLHRLIVGERLRQPGTPNSTATLQRDREAHAARLAACQERRRRPD